MDSDTPPTGWCWGGRGYPALQNGKQELAVTGWLFSTLRPNSCVCPNLRAELPVSGPQVVGCAALS